MISGLQNALISGWYPVDMLDIKLLDSVETWLFPAIFRAIYYLTTDIWQIFRHIQQIFFTVPMKSVINTLEIWSIFSWNPFIVPLISGWYPWYPIRFPQPPHLASTLEILYPLQKHCEVYECPLNGPFSDDFPRMNKPTNRFRTTDSRLHSWLYSIISVAELEMAEGGGTANYGTCIQPKICTIPAVLAICPLVNQQNCNLWHQKWILPSIA